MKRMLLVAWYVCVVTSSSALGQSAQPTSEAPYKAKVRVAGTETPRLGAADRAFVMAAAQGGIAGVELGRLAASKDSSPDVRQFAQRMVDANGKVNEELKPLLKAQNLALPAELDARNKAIRDWLLKLSGAEFDRAYMGAMLAKHAHDEMVFQRAAMMSMDPDLKAWASKTLPTVQEHHEMAKEINRKVAGVSATTPKRP